MWIIRSCFDSMHRFLYHRLCFLHNTQLIISICSPCHSISILLNFLSTEIVTHTPQYEKGGSLRFQMRIFLFDRLKIEYLLKKSIFIYCLWRRYVILNLRPPPLHERLPKILTRRNYHLCLFFRYVCLAV